MQTTGNKGKGKDTRELILDSAEALFAAKGFGGTRIRDISAKAGVTSAMIHYYFTSKEELLRAVQVRLVEELVTLVDRIAPEPIAFIPKLKLFFESLFDYAACHKNFTRITAMDMGNKSEDGFGELVALQLHPLYEKAKGFLTEGMQRGVFNPIDPDHLLIALIGMIVPYFSETPFLENLLGKNVHSENEQCLRRELLLQMIFRILLKDPVEV